VNLSYVGSIRVEEPSGDSSLSVAEGEVDTVDQIQARYIVAVANERRKGINVSEEAQWIFNQLHKMYNSCHWNEKDISIPDVGVTIKPPYTVENCVGGGEGLQRVKKILQRLHEERKIKSKQ
jgi:hypothetical protein